MALLDLRHRRARLVLFEEAEVGAEVEEVVLDARQGRGEALVEARRQGDAEVAEASSSTVP